MFTRSPDKVSIEYLATAWDAGVWKSRLYINTGLIPEAGVRYRITADVTCDEDMPFVLLFNNDEVEKGLGAMFGLIAKPSGQYVEYVTYAKQDTDLVIQLSLGTCAPPNSIILEKVAVEKAGRIDLVSDTVYTF